jgi:hypothetical protein
MLKWRRGERGLLFALLDFVIPSSFAVRALSLARRPRLGVVAGVSPADQKHAAGTAASTHRDDLALVSPFGVHARSKT